jgi:hypothetical protein
MKTVIIFLLALIFNMVGFVILTAISIFIYHQIESEINDLRYNFNSEQDEIL